MAGWVYIATNEAMPDIVKVGYTDRHPNQRASEFNQTGVPYNYVVAYAAKVAEPRKLEKQAHDALHECKERKEWFRCSVVKAQAIIRKKAGPIYLEIIDGQEIEPPQIEPPSSQGPAPVRLGCGRPPQEEPPNDLSPDILEQVMENLHPIDNPSIRRPPTQPPPPVDTTTPPTGWKLWEPVILPVVGGIVTYAILLLVLGDFFGDVWGLENIYILSLVPSVVYAWVMYSLIVRVAKSNL